jgi:hypothetical protein
MLRRSPTTWDPDDPRESPVWIQSMQAGVVFPASGEPLGDLHLDPLAELQRRGLPTVARVMSVGSPPAAARLRIAMAWTGTLSLLRAPHLFASSRSRVEGDKRILKHRAAK